MEGSGNVFGPPATPMEGGYPDGGPTSPRDRREDATPPHRYAQHTAAQEHAAAQLRGAAEEEGRERLAASCRAINDALELSGLPGPVRLPAFHLNAKP